MEHPEGGIFPLMPEGAAMRLPAQALAALGVFLLFMAGYRRGGSVIAGLLAAGWFILLPRVAFNASLHTFDVPTAVTALALVLAYLRALNDPRWGLALGPLLGVAISVKHNALFMAGLLGLHYLLCLLIGRLRGKKVRWKQLIALPMLSMAILAPLTAVVLWPWLWHDTIDRITGYFAFHTEHNYYNMEFLGVNHNRPPLPISYPWVMTLATVPLTLLLISGVGLVLGVLRDIGAPDDQVDDQHAPLPTWSRPLPSSWDRAQGSLLALFALFPLALIALPSIPIFGGTKHWLTAYPFLALTAAVAWRWLWGHLPSQGSWRHAPAVALFVILIPSFWSTVHGHPYNLSQYAPLAGGARGAANLGLNRGFWGHATLALFDTDPAGSASSKMYLHDIHPLAQRQYQREGRWPRWGGARPEHAQGGLIFHEMHTAQDEIRLWNALGRTDPAEIITLDDVPLTSRYRR